MTADTEKIPGPVVDLAIDGVFHLPPSRDAKREALGIITILAALLLHALVVALLLTSWRTPMASLRPLQVTLRPEVPKPPPKPEQPKPKAEAPKPKPKPEPEKPKPKAEEKPPTPPPEIKPRESGPDQKTEATKTDKPKEALPKALPIQPKAEEVPPPPDPTPQPPEEKPTPPRAKVKENAAGRGTMVPREILPPALQPQRPTAPAIRNLVVRLPGPGGGNAARDSVGDTYLNHLRDLIERNRLYPPADAFLGTYRPVAVFSVVIEPSGQIVTITLLSSSGVPKLDEVAREMITNTEPFPRVPPDYPQIRTVITMFLPIFPAR